MSQAATSVAKQHKSSRAQTLRRIRRDIPLYLILLPGLIWLIVFKFAPMFGLVVAFQNYQPYTGVLNSPFVGFAHFKDFFSGPQFPMLMRNTLILSLYNIVFYFPAPIILALLLNEIRSTVYKRVVQTMVYVPHFISMVIVASITYMLLTGGSTPSQAGIIHKLHQNMTGVAYNFLGEPAFFRPMITVQVIWKETGWGTIIFLAALSGVDEQLYEAAIIDGAGRWKQLWHITLPSIKGTIVIMLILRMGTVLDNGFEHIFLMSNALNRSVSEVFDTYVYTTGIKQASFSYAAAVGLFKSIVSVILVQTVNSLAKKTGESGLY